MGYTTDPEDVYLRKIDPETKLQAKYLVLSEADRNKGFIRPVRREYIHEPRFGGCGAVTTMGQPLAETYAAQPDFYGATYCANCRDHFPVGENGQFVWARAREGTPLGDQDKVGT